MNVNDLGSIGLPLSERDAKVIVERCHQSPFGKGGETLVDTAVRKSHELNANEFSIRNPAWDPFICSLVSSAYQQLALTCHRENVRAELYKLLLYEEGAFFKPHQDSEKTPGMFGTLVVCLPSLHEGGRIVLSHNKQKYIFDSSLSSDFDTSFAAWYADVFHEVELVTSGYRLVLTYNLVQSGGRLPQNAPDGDTKSKLVDILKQYEIDAAEDKSYASFAAHKLEHFYTQESLSISSLKGKDYQIVELLRDACKSLDFDVYLATFEKEVQRDDDTGSEIYEHSESFTYVTSLDGTQEELTFKYSKGCITWDSEDEATGDADESEHEGYTGNEGAPATFWYRDTVVLIVPPSRKIDTILESNGKSYKQAMEITDRLQCEAQEDTMKHSQLMRICQLLLPQVIFKTNATAWSHPDSHSQPYKEAAQCRQRIIIIALQLENPDLFAQAASKFELSDTVLDEFGNALEKSGLTFWTAAVIQLLDAAVNIAKKWQILKAILKCLTNTTVGEGLAFDEWLQEMLNLILNTTECPRKDDGETFAELALHPCINAQKQIVPRILDNNAMVIGGFVIKYNSRVGGEAEADQAYLLDMLIQNFWDKFEFFSTQEIPPSTNDFYLLKRNNIEVESFICNELITLIEISLSRSGTEVKTIFEKMAEATFSLSTEYLQDTMLPFIEALVCQKILRVGHEEESVRNFVKLVLHQYTLKFVQNEPVRPTHWAMPTSTIPCVCNDCKKIRDFFASRTQKQLDISAPKEHRRHLESNYGRPHPGASFKTETVKQGIPHTWRITKNHAPYEQEHRWWKARQKEAETTVWRMGGGKGLPKLEAWLGEQFKQITACKAEMLPILDEFYTEQRLPLQESGGNAAERNNNSRRRKVEGDAENWTPAKRVAAGQREVVEVIDLT